ncbi:MAG: hypothetical protein K2J11_05335, partial [Oscillospiraceae bacterium]|nr:hypothetical protein [Oscillospiraceae bacterium]
CNSEGQSPQTEQNVTAAETMSETAQAAANPETEQTEETSISETETSAEEQSEPELTLPENMKLLNTAKLNGGRSGLGYLKGSIYCELLGDCPHFYDINTQTLEAKVDIPAGGRSFISQTDDSCLCKLHVWSKENDSDKVITVYNDYTCDIADYAPETISFNVCGHSIAEYGYDIIDTDKNVTILEGGVWEDSENYGYRFLFEIDENRFVYQKCGDIESFGFGIYDFETGSAIDIPDTVWHTPFGFHDGKIYSQYFIENEHADKFPDGVRGDIYITDIETGEKQHGFDCPLSDSDYISYEYAMPENGEFIAFLATPDKLETPYAFCIIDPDTGDIIREYEVLCRDKITYRSIWFADNDTAVISNGDSKLIVADLSR